jgi:hypothetical protein
VWQKADFALFSVWGHQGSGLSTGGEIARASSGSKWVEKGDKRRTIGLHYAAAQAIHEYRQRAEISSGPLFRPQRHSHTEELAASAMEPRTMWTILKEYLSKLPNALRERELPDGSKVMECVYTPHSLRASGVSGKLGQRQLYPAARKSWPAWHKSAGRIRMSMSRTSRLPSFPDRRSAPATRAA